MSNKPRLGTKGNPVRVLVADNWGQDAHPHLKSRFPNVTFKTYVETPSPHPHGHMVAECICQMIDPSIHAEITFLNYLDLQDKPEYQWNHVLETAEEPFHIMNGSFGRHHRNDDILQMFFDSEWAKPEKLQGYKEQIGNTVLVFAAGNEDSSRGSYADADNDVNYPQKYLSELEKVFVIGACDKYGNPSDFSSDGEEVFAMYFGEGVPVFDPTSSRNMYVNGTSFAAPFATGNLINEMVNGAMINEEWFRDYILKYGWFHPQWIADGLYGQRHRKAGYGCMLSVMQQSDYYRRVMGLKEDVRSLEIKYHDLDKL